MQVYATPGNQYDMLFIAKGGGSANKTMLYQQVGVQQHLRVYTQTACIFLLVWIWVCGYAAAVELSC